MKKRVFRAKRRGIVVDPKANTIEIKAIKEKPRTYKKGAKNGNDTTNIDN